MNMPGQGTPVGVPIDVRVADYFCRKCTNFHDVPAGTPFLAANLFGLVCFDSENGELLMPMTSNLTHPHRARIYTTATISKGQSDGTEQTPAIPPIAFWDINGYTVDWVLLDSMGNWINDTPTAPVRSLYDSPWNNFKFIRNIVAVGGKPLLTDRNDSSRLKSRVILKGDYVEVGAPYTTLGQFSEWTVRQADGKYVVGATSDNMTFVRVLPEQTATIRILFKPIGSSPAKDSVELGLTGNRLVLAVTHATEHPPVNPKKLEDTKAFALLLQGGDVAAFPTAVFSRGVHGESDQQTAGFISSSDGHCEGGGGG